MATTVDVEKTVTLAGDEPAADLGHTSGPDCEDLTTTAAAVDDEPEPDFADGGFRAWSQVVACGLTNMMSWGYPSAFGVYQLYYRDKLNVPDSQISWIGSIQVFLAFLMCVFSGRLADAGYIRSTVIVGAFLTVFGTFMTSIATEYWQIVLAQGICSGLGLGTMFMPPLSVVSSYFKKKRSLALALTATGTGFGSIVFPSIIQYLIPRVGFPWAVRCAAFVALFISILALLILRPQLKPRKSGPMFEWGAFREAPYVLYSLGSFLFFWALYFGVFYVNAYARNIIGFSTTDSVQLLLLVNGMSIPSRPVVGFVADNVLGPINTFALAVAVFAGMQFAWTGVHTRAGMYAFAAAFGLANGAAQGVFVGSLASLTRDPRKMGTRFGMVCTMVAFATLAGPPTAGAIIDRAGGRYLYAQVWAGVVILLGAVTLAAARVASTGWKLKVRI